MPAPAPSPARWQAATVLLLALAAVLGAMWWSTRSELDDVEQRLGAEIAEERADTDLGDTVRDALTYDAAIELSAADLVSLRFGYLAPEDESELRELLEDLGFDDDVMARIGASRAVDGTLSADGDDVEALWSYHPDDGLRLVLRSAT